MAQSVLAQDNAARIFRTEHVGGDPAAAMSQVGGVIHTRVAAGKTYSFWYKRMPLEDTNTTDVVGRAAPSPILFLMLEEPRVRRAAGVSVAASELPNDGVWHFVTMEFDCTYGSGGRVLFYLDGAQTPFKTAPFSNSFFTGMILYIGTEYLAGVAAHAKSTDYNLLIDDFITWNTISSSVRQLTQTISQRGVEAIPARGQQNLEDHKSFDTAASSAGLYSIQTTIHGQGGNIGHNVYNMGGGLNGGRAPTLQPATNKSTRIVATVTSRFGIGNRLTPPRGESLLVYSPDPQDVVTFSAPEYIYLDRLGNELGTSDDLNPSDFVGRAMFRARYDGYTVNGSVTQSGDTAARRFTLPRTDDLAVEWRWVLEYAVALESNAGNALTGSSAGLLVYKDGQAPGGSSSFGRLWVEAGTQVSGALNRTVGLDGTGNTRYTLKNIVYEGLDSVPGSDRCMVFDGVNDVLDLTDKAPLPDMTDFTIESWVRWDGARRSANQVVATFYTGASASPSRMSWGIRTSTHATHPNQVFFDCSAGAFHIDPSFLDTSWRHWAWSYSQSARELKCYRDGRLIRTFTGVNLNFDSAAEKGVNWRFHDQDWNGGTPYNVNAKWLVSTGLGIWPLFLSGTGDYFDHQEPFWKSPRGRGCVIEYSGKVLLPKQGNYTFFANGEQAGEVYLDGVVGTGRNGGSVPGEFGMFGTYNDQPPGPHNLVMRGLDFNTDPTAHLAHSINDGTGARQISREHIYRRLATVQIGNVGVSSPWGGCINNLRLWTSTLDAAAVAAAKTTKDYADNTANLEFEFTFDDDTLTHAAGVGRSIYGGMLQNFGNLHFDSLPPATKLRLLYPSTTTEAVADVSAAQVSTDNIILNGSIGMRFVFAREFKLQLTPATTAADPALIAGLPYVIVDGANLYDSSKGHAWVPEDKSVRVGTRYRYSQFPNCLTLSGITGASGVLTRLGDETVVDATGPGGHPSREVTIPTVTSPGAAVLNFGKTLYRAELPLGEFLDVRDLARLNAKIVPDLCTGGNLDLVSGPSGMVDSQAVRGVAIDFNNNMQWDGVGKRLLPLAPGIITVAWPDVDGRTVHHIQLISDLPTNTINNLPYDREDPVREGFRLGSHPAYQTSTAMANVADAFPGSPRANYLSLFDSSSVSTGPIPIELDPNNADRWYFHKVAYSSSNDIQRTTPGVSGPAAKQFRATGAGRAVLLYGYRPDPNQVANGDTSREAYLSRVVEVKGSLDDQDRQDALSSGDRKAARLGGGADHRFDINPGGSGANVELVSDRARTIEFWLRKPASAGGSPAADRIVLEQSGVAGGRYLRAGIRGSGHSSAPDRFFVEQPRSVAEDFNTRSLPAGSVLERVGSASPVYPNQYAEFRRLDNEYHLRTKRRGVAGSSYTAEVTTQAFANSFIESTGVFGMGNSSDGQKNIRFQLTARRDSSANTVSYVLNGTRVDLPSAGLIQNAAWNRVRMTYDADAKTIQLSLHQNYTQGAAFVASTTFPPIDVSGADLDPVNSSVFFGNSFSNYDDFSMVGPEILSLPEVRDDGLWHHWALRYTPPVSPSPQGSLAVFIDGREVGRWPFVAGMTAAQATSMRIGNSGLKAFGPLGDIDNLRIWDRALTTAQIRAGMRRHTPASTTGLSLNLTFDSAPTGSTFYNSGGLTVTTPATTPGDLLVVPGEDTFPEVATRVLSKFDTSGFRSGYILAETVNYNADRYDRTADAGRWGSLFPVNSSRAVPGAPAELVWYANPWKSMVPQDTTANLDAVLHPNVDWPWISVRTIDIDFPSKGKDKDGRIYIASRLGSEGVDANGRPQLRIDPALYDNFTLYNQPVRASDGYNPNEEHALIEESKAAAFLSDSTYNLGQNAAFALQKDLNQTVGTGSTYTSAPWVLVQYQEKATGEWHMKAYRVEKERTATPTPYRFRYGFKAGDIVVQPYPLNRVVGNVIMRDDQGGNIAVNNIAQRTLWFDKNQQGWVVSGGGQFFYQFWYPFRADFWYDLNRDGANDFDPGEPIAWVPSNGKFRNTGTKGEPQRVLFDTTWDTDYPKLKRGETVTFAGGENKAENPLDQGLPAVVAMASAELIYDSATPTMAYDKTASSSGGVRIKDPVSAISARVTRPLDRHEHHFPIRDMPPALTPSAVDNVFVVAERWYFKALTGSLQKRFYYDSLLEKLVFRGRVNDREGGDPNLTEQPVGLSIIEPNTLTEDEFNTLLGLDGLPGAGPWEVAIGSIFQSSQNPHGFSASGFATPTKFPGIPRVYYSGLQKPAAGGKGVPFYNAAGTKLGAVADGAAAPLRSLGAGSALVPTASLLTQDTAKALYLTVAENNHPSTDGAVSLHIIQIVPDRFRGAVKMVEAADLFDDKVNLSHTGDFGGDTRGIYYEWWVRDVAALNTVGTPETDSAWQLYTDGLNQRTISFTGRPDITLADKLFFVRYGEKNELGDVTGQSNSLTANPDPASTTRASWRLVDLNDPAATWTRAGSANTGDSTGGAVPFQWAGAANSPQLQANGSKKYIPQLVMGWVKRVLDRVNPYEARYSDFFNSESPATYSSQIQIAGGPFIGKVALNASKNVIENVGLIQLYETVLARARELTLDIPGVATDSTNQAVLLAATRLAFLYELLAREAYSDAQSPLVPVSDANGLGGSAAFIHAFQNQEPDLLHEELALLRGTDFLKAAPSFNRLFWNYVKGTGEAAYNAVYSIRDSNSDGFINEFDAAQQYPQGHGDAWGHFLSANNMHYTLLGLSEFGWQARDELYALLDNVIEADYLDEKSFARIAAAKARTGLEIVRATYREAYTSNPDGQWQGYTDTANPARAWGVSEWSKRAGQAAYFDWAVGNAVVPPNTSANQEGLARIDRQANVAELGEIAGAIAGIQSALDGANRGANPAGLDADSITFDIDPLAFSGGGSGDRKSHFEQVYERAVAAAGNAVAAHRYASASEMQLRKVADDTDQLRLEALRQDLDYRNRLIELFGTPYDGQVGPGKPFPEGYEGPDTLMYLYVDRVDPAKLFPTKPSSNFVNLQSKLTSAKSTYGTLTFDNWFFAAVPNFKDSVSQIFDNSYLTAAPPTDRILFQLPAEIRTRDFAFVVPDANTDGIPDWGKRRSQGQIQVLLNELLLEELALQRSIRNYENFVHELTIQTDRMVALLESSQIKTAARRDASFGKLAGAALQAAGTAGQSWFDWIIKYSLIDGSNFAQSMPYVVGVSNDPSFIPRSVVLNLFTGIARGAEIPRAAMTFLRELGVVQQSLIDSQLHDQETRANEFMELRGVIADLASLLQQEEGKRLGLGEHVQQIQMQLSALDAKIAEGFRLMDEREAFNARVAASAQRNRYSDMVSRISRSEALTKYQSAYDNAVRYAWLAAKAYDYETSLDPGDPAAATTFLESILKERQLGLWTGGQPQTGNGGLAEILATMKANYDVLEGQLGINNPQRETGLLSLRHERFRIAREGEASDTRWFKTLASHKVADLWGVPEFRQYCRPFADPSDGPQPGLVVEFSTEITPGRNVFGRELGGADHAYSAANFATKIRSLGVWFEGYNHTGLATTPRVYLVPVGNDVLRVANSDRPQTRRWNVVEQAIPVPFAINDANLARPGFIPSVAGTDGSFAERRRFGDFRAYHTGDGGAIDPAQMATTSRLIGRSVWNTRWLLVIPGAALHADPDYGVDQFLRGVKDIKLQFETYSNEGS